MPSHPPSPTSTRRTQQQRIASPGPSILKDDGHDQPESCPEGLQTLALEAVRNDRKPLSRRRLIGAALLSIPYFAAVGRPRSATAAQSHTTNPTSAPSPSPLRIAVIGLGRGLDLARAAASISGVQISHLCDVDERRLTTAAQQLASRLPTVPQRVRDLRRILDDPSVHAVMIATCNHWHAPATILACQAGKHVYVEKPGSHNPQEGEWMAEAARKHQRLVQLGTQRRSWPGIAEGIQRLHEGVIGPLHAARSWYVNARPSIGRGRAVTPPPELDFGLWQGPAPERAYKDNLVHYNWHWHWHYGGGELANNGPHYLDLVRWGLGLNIPHTVDYAGGRYHHLDDQETPDTGVVSFDFKSAIVTWEHSSCHPRKNESFPLVRFYGEGGTLALAGAGYQIEDATGKEIAKGSGPSGDQLHVANFVDAIRLGTPLTAPIEDGQKSTLLCHLGNIAYRSRQRLECDSDPQFRRLRSQKHVGPLWQRSYRKGWKPNV